MGDGLTAKDVFLCGISGRVGSRLSTHRRRGANLRHGAPSRAAPRARRTALRAARRHACIKSACGTKPACGANAVVKGPGAMPSCRPASSASATSTPGQRSARLGAPFAGRSKLYALAIKRAQTDRRSGKRVCKNCPSRKIGEDETFRPAKIFQTIPLSGRRPGIEAKTANAPSAPADRHLGRLIFARAAAEYRSALGAPGWCRRGTRRLNAHPSAC